MIYSSRKKKFPNYRSSLDLNFNILLEYFGASLKAEGLRNASSWVAEELCVI